MQLYMSPHTTLAVDAHGEANANPWIFHFGLVMQVDEAKECNMELAWHSENVGDFNISIPSLVNKRQLKAGETLKRKLLDDVVLPPTKK